MPFRFRLPRRHTLTLLLGVLCLIVVSFLVVPSTETHVTWLVDSSKERFREWTDTHWNGNFWREWDWEKGGLVDEAGWLKQVEQVEASHGDDADDLSSDSGIDACEDWNPDGKEKDDPAKCLLARQYRQVQRVLEREELAEHVHWYFTQDHNIKVLKHLLQCFLPSTHPSHASCPRKPLILSGWWYTAEVVSGATTGEVIWQTGLMKQVEELGLSFIAVGPYSNWIQVAEMMPDVYRVIWNSDIDTVSCISDPRCIAKDHYAPSIDGEDKSTDVPDEERGVIPIWALNIVDYWGCRPLEMSHVDHWWNHTEKGDWSYHPLGQQWIATPWPLPGGHVHLPYSIEEQCLQLPMTPHAERNEAVLLFAKKAAYFDYDQVSPRHYWTDLAKDPTFEFISTATEEDGHRLPDGLTSLGKQTREDYEKLVGGAKVLLGMGAPQISPSVYSALCQGTPVVVPYFVPNLRTDGWHLYSGLQQHGPAAQIGEPYVYTYYARNYSELVEVVHRALNTPIERYIPPEMKFEYGLAKMREYLDRDLQQMFDQVLASNGGHIPRMAGGASERCRELNRCAGFLPAGRKPKAWRRVESVKPEV